MRSARLLVFTIHAGDKTCAYEPGKFCQYVRTTHFGTRFLCHLFDEPLVEEDGWLQRRPKCLFTESDATRKLEEGKSDE